jgi:large repetitive protein
MAVLSRAMTGSGKLVAVALAVTLAATTVVAHAVVTTVFDQPFHNNSANGTGAVTKPALPFGMPGTNTVCLTASGNPVGALHSCPTFPDAQGAGKLRLTETVNSTVGAVFGAGTTGVAMTANKGIHTTFNLYQYGGAGADGTVFALAATDPANPQPPTFTGQGGGSLGFAPVRSSGQSGLPNAYLGFGFDAFGAFSTTDRQGVSCPAQSYIPATNIAGQVVVRGPGSGVTGYCGINSTATNTSSPALPLRAATRPASAMPVEVVLNPTSGTIVTGSGLSVPTGQYLVKVTLVGGAVRTLSGALPTVPAGMYPFPSWLSANSLPRHLVFGWTAATGGLADFHELDEAKVYTLDPAPVLTVTQTSYVAPAPQPGDPVIYTVTPAVAAGTAEAAPVTVTQTLPAGVVPLGAFGTGWVCQAPSGQSISCTNSNTPFAGGTSLPAITVVAIVTSTGVTPASVQSGTTATVSASDAVAGAASSAPAGTLGTAPVGVTVSPASGPAAGGNAVTVSGTGVVPADAIEIGTSAQFQAGTPAVLLPCPSGPAAGCFTTSGGTLQISAMPAHAAGPVQVKVVNDGVAGTGTYTYVDPLALTFAPPPAGNVGAAYATTLTATGGLLPYTWSLSAGSLPPGLQLGAASGTISGTPTVAGTFSFTARVADAAGGTATRATSITVDPGPLSITVPGTVDFGAAPPGATTLTADLGAVTVVDHRGDQAAAWVVTVDATTFTTGTGGSGQTVPTGRVAYDTGSWSSSGTGTFVPASLPPGALPGVGASWVAGVGANTVTWQPDLTFTFTQQVAGQYTGIITHSVA